MQTHLRSISILFAALGLLVIVGCAQLPIASVNAPAYNYWFNTNGTIVVNDTVTNLWTGGGSTGQGLTAIMQSRTFQGQPPASQTGIFGYEYRLVLKNLTGADNVSISSISFRFTPISTINGNQVWVVTSGGLGTVGPASANTSNGNVTFNFNPPVSLSAGAAQETSTYFFGMASSQPPQNPNFGIDLVTLEGTRTISGQTLPITYYSLVRSP